MRVVWFCHSSEIGGAELCLLDAVGSLGAHGVESHLLLPRRGPIEARLRSMGIPYTRHRYRCWVAPEHEQTAYSRTKRAGQSVASLPSLLYWLRRFQPDVIVTNTMTLPTGAVAARILGIPHLWYIHELGEDMGLHFDWGERRSLRLMGFLTTRAVVVSNAVRDKFREWIPGDRIRLVYNAAQVPERPPAPLPPLDGPLRLVTLGKKYAGKRQEDTIRAVALLAQAGVSCHLTLVGQEDPDYAPYLRRLVKELGVQDRVELKMEMSVPDAFLEIERAHVLVMSSRNEAFGRVTIEAMKLGRPVVGSNRGGTPELIQDGWNGLLFRAEDPEDLAAKLLILDRDRSKLATMARNAREWAFPRFRLDQYAAEMYEALLETSEEPTFRGRTLVENPSLR